MELTEEQKAAVESDSSRTMVLAGPGAGKTHVVVERVMHKLARDSMTGQMMISTFSRKAAAEIRNRLIERIGRYQVNKMTIGTLHSIAFGLIDRFKEFLGYRRTPSLYNEADTDMIISSLIAEMRYKVSKKKVYAACKLFYRFQDSVPATKEEHIAYEFVTQCKRNHIVTYDQLLYDFTALIPRVSAFFGWKELIIDEAQDIDSVQWDIIQAICGKLGASLFIVGDIDQSIYAWRGAVPEYLMTIKDSTKSFNIRRNFRSDGYIIAAANNLITGNSRRICDGTKQVLNPCRKPVVVLNNYDSEHVTDFIIRDILTRTPAKKVAVLSRIHNLLPKMGFNLAAANIPVSYISRDKVVGTEPFSKFNAFLRLTENPYDDFSFKILQDVFEISSRHVSEIMAKAVDDQTCRFEAAKRLGLMPELFDSPEPDFFVLSAQIIRILSLNGFHMKDTENFIEKYKCNYMTTDSYLKWLSLYDMYDTVSTDPDALTLTTIHGAKGLEWDTVVVIGCNEGILPLKNSDTEEERRLMYVAMTRARRELYLCVRADSEESRFIKEIV